MKTKEYKNERIRDFCTGHLCVTCPLYDKIPKDESCYGDDANIDRNYKILFSEESTLTDNVNQPTDNVNHPSHYETGKFECIDVMVETQGVEAVMDFCLCNAFKYIYRTRRKNGLEDVKKAIWYLTKYVELEATQNNEQNTPCADRVYHSDYELHYCDKHKGICEDESKCEYRSE